MKFVLLFVLIIATLASAKNLLASPTAFVKFQNDYDKFYTSAEYRVRYEIFRSNIAKINALNQESFESGSDATFDVNEFADLSEQEFEKYYLNAQPMIRTENEAEFLSDDYVSALPESIDYREKGVVTPVKNQGQCGSCWSFSSTGNVEGQWAIATGNLVSLSEQNLVDCSHDCMPFEGEIGCNEGCNGGLMPLAFDWIIKNGGIDSEKSYPYKARNGQCAFKPQNIAAKLTNHTMIPKNETQIKAYLNAIGPLAIAVDAKSWPFYSGGIFDRACGENLSHAVLLVGYSTDKATGKQYYIIKNSWGSWGEKGYIRVPVGVNKCGVSNFVCTGLV
eukprot:gene5735-7132_t